MTPPALPHVSPGETVCRSHAVYRQLRPRARFSLSLPPWEPAMPIKEMRAMMMTLPSGHITNSAKDIVMAGEDFHRPGEASWSVDEIRYHEIERDRIKEDTQLLYLLTSASFVEITSDLYPRNLVEFFCEDRETVQLLGEGLGPAELEN